MLVTLVARSWLRYDAFIQRVIILILIVLPYQNSTNIYNTSLDGWMGGTEVNKISLTDVTHLSKESMKGEKCIRHSYYEQVLPHHG